MDTLGVIHNRFLFKNTAAGPSCPVVTGLASGKGKYRYLGVTTSITSCLQGLDSGINVAGVAVAFTFADHAPLFEAVTTKTPHHAVVEAVLGGAGDLVEALQVAISYLRTPLVGGNLVIVTPEGGAVIEHLYPQFSVDVICPPTLVRTNHFVNLEVSREMEGDFADSWLRYQRLTALLASEDSDDKFGLAEIKQALSDHEGIYPICRHNGLEPKTASVIYDVREKSLYYRYGNPCAGEFAHHTVDNSFAL
jgi:hypothetical protein